MTGYKTGYKRINAPFTGSNRGQGRHGTHSGYVTHHAAGEPACDECKAAHAAWRRDQRARQADQRKLTASSDKVAEYVSMRLR